MTLVSVKGAGFKASSDQPVSMEEVLNGFLYGKTLPYKYMPLSLDKGIVFMEILTKISEELCWCNENEIKVNW